MNYKDNLEKIKSFFSKKGESLLLFFVLLVAAYFRFKGLSTRDLWLDEIYSVQQSMKGLLQITKEVPTPIHYYFIYIFSWFGTSSFVLGLPSVIFGLLSVFLAYVIGKMLLGKNTGLVAAFLLAISPMHIEFSQQVLFFSYYVFFSLLSLYFLLDFMLGLRERKTKWMSLFLFFIAGWINILTQMVALVVTAIEGVIFICFSITQKQFWVMIKKYFIPLLLAVGVMAYAIFFVGSGGYKSFFQDKVSFDRNVVIPLGYSLSNQMGTGSLVFNESFFKAMFSWFGLGPANRLWAYLALFFLGILSMVASRSKRIKLLLAIFWIFLPFVFLYFIRLNHWFEEKYFIFIIPIYLLVIAEGIVFFTRAIQRILVMLFTKLSSVAKWPKSMWLLMRSYVLFQVVIAAFVSLYALYPIERRVSFGFPFKGHVTYNWREAYNYLDNKLKKDDKVFLRKGGSLFLDYYFGSKGKKKLLEEPYVAGLSSAEYSELVAKKNKNYFVSVSDFSFLFLAPITEYQLLSNKGSVSVHEIKFKKNSPIEVKNNSSGEWEYYDDFQSSKYLSDAADWNNIVTTFAETPGIPRSETYNELSAIDFSSAHIDYRFILPENTKNFFIKPQFLLNKDTRFKVFTGENKENLKLAYEKEANITSFFNPAIKTAAYKGSKNFYIRLAFEFKDGIVHIPGGARLKSVWISNSSQAGTRSPQDYSIESRDGRSEYSYGGALEVSKSNRWLYHTITNEGWMQTEPGFLARIYGEKKTHPLVYKFNFDKEIENWALDVKAIVSEKVPADISYSTNGKDWKLLKQLNYNFDGIVHFDLANVNSKELYFKMETELPGTVTQLRNITFKAVSK